MITPVGHTNTTMCICVLVVYVIIINNLGTRQIHASFIINEAISYYKKGGSPCYVITLDMKKAFDEMWRDGLFIKLIE